MYDHFQEVFKRRVSAFGEERMRKAVDELRRINEHVRTYQACTVVLLH